MFHPRRRSNRGRLTVKDVNELSSTQLSQWAGMSCQPFKRERKYVTEAKQKRKMNRLQTQRHNYTNVYNSEKSDTHTTKAKVGRPQSQPVALMTERERV